MVPRPIDVLRNKWTVNDRLGNEKISLIFDKRTDSLTVKDGKGREVTHIIVYWFVWKDSNPRSELYKVP